MDKNMAAASAQANYPARWWKPLPDGRIECLVCPRLCKLQAGQRGFCFVRQNVEGRMALTTYGRSSGFCVDPIEKKPLNHFYPGTSVLSFGTAGCNLGCRFCQNWDISKAREFDRLADEASPETIAAAARRLGCRSVAFTYNDPVIFAEYAMDVADACRQAGVAAVAVTAGYMTEDSRPEFYRHMDAANVDLKGFTEEFYHRRCYGQLAPVLDTLKYLRHETRVWFEVTTLLIPGENDSEAEIEKASDYSCTDADLTGRLNDILTKELQAQDLWQLYDETEMPLVPVLLAMEENGIAVDTKIMAAMSRDLGEKIRKLETTICDCAGQVFNINSPAQLGMILGDKMHMDAVKKKSGGYSTAADILEGLRGVDPIIGHILEFRQLSKLKSTYVDALPMLVNPKTGRIHTSFNQTRTSTGRLSSSDPNLQNIPIRDEVGRRIREAFIAPAGSMLMGVDYSQIDLRALAHLSQDENLLNAFRHDEDIHTATAAQLYNVPPAEVTSNMRRLAKTVNFGVIYGMSGYGLEQATELSREDAGKFITAYFEKYPGVKKYLEATKEQARRTGYVQTILGRKRVIQDINSSNRQVREAAERMAINMPVQGTSADIIKKAMINLHREMLSRQLKSKMLLQVHDELVFEVPEDEMAEMRQLVPEMMVNAIKLSIPLKVETKTGKNWGEMEK